MFLRRDNNGVRIAISKAVFGVNEWKGLPLDMRLINFRAIIG